MYTMDFFVWNKLIWSYNNTTARFARFGGMIPQQIFL